MTARGSIARIFALLLSVTAGCADEAAPESALGRSLEPLAVAGPERSIDAVKWPQSSVDENARAQLSVRSLEVIRKSPVPVLVPKQQELLAGATVLSEANWYALSTRAGGITARVSATRVSHRVRGVEPVEGREALRGAKGFVTQNEGIWSATWKENGVSYVVDVECDRVAEDERCSSADFVRSLVNDLVYVGGAGQEVTR